MQAFFYGSQSKDGSIFDQIITELSDQKYKGKALYVTGHSLGECSTAACTPAACAGEWKAPRPCKTSALAIQSSSGPTRPHSSLCSRDVLPDGAHTAALPVACWALLPNWCRALPCQTLNATWASRMSSVAFWLHVRLPCVHACVRPSTCGDGAHRNMLFPQPLSLHACRRRARDDVRALPGVPGRHPQPHGLAPQGRRRGSPLNSRKP